MTDIFAAMPCSVTKYYSALSENERKTGLINFAKYPPDDTSFLTTRLWDKYLPLWREIRAKPEEPLDPEGEKKLVDELKRKSDSPELRPRRTGERQNTELERIPLDIYNREGVEI